MRLKPSGVERRRQGNLDDVADIALRASSRRGVDFAAIKAAEASKARPRSQSFDLIFRPDGLADPWPEGPLARVDTDFAKVAIEQHRLLPLFDVRPRETREAVLGCLIEEPQRPSSPYPEPGASPSTVTFPTGAGSVRTG